MLIHYERPDTAGPKLSDYTIATTEAGFSLSLVCSHALEKDLFQTPNELQAILSQTLGVLGEFVYSLPAHYLFHREGEEAETALFSGPDQNPH